MTCGGDASIRVAKPIGKGLPRQCVQCYKWCVPFYGMIRDYMRLNTAHYAIAPRAKLRHERQHLIPVWMQIDAVFISGRGVAEEWEGNFEWTSS